MKNSSNDLFIKKEKSNLYSRICRDCGEEITVLMCTDTRTPEKSSYYETILCSCEKARKESEVEEGQKHKRDIFSKKCKKYFDFFECDSDIENHTFNNFEINSENKQAFDEAKKATFGYFSKYGINFIGKYGSGKTRLLKTMGFELHLKGEDVIFVEYSRIFDRIFATYDKNNKEKESDLLDCLMNVRNLFIDELGVGTNSPAKEDLFLKIINARSKKGLRTHFSMNPEGQGNISPRISSRLVEFAKPVLNDAPDFRPNVLAKNIELEEKALLKGNKA